MSGGKINGLRSWTAVCAVCLVAAPCVRIALNRPAASAAAIVPSPWMVPTASGPFDRVLRQAWRCRMRAHLREIRQRDAVEAWDAAALAADGAERRLRRELLAMDPGGDLHRASRLTHRAAALARSPDERFRVAQLRAGIARDLGDHRAEQQQAQQMLVLKPRDWRSREAVWHAKFSNGFIEAPNRCTGRILATCQCDGDQDRGAMACARPGKEEIRCDFLPVR
jgi:hypothetical protein